jgi:hypothetical protein
MADNSMTQSPAPLIDLREGKYEFQAPQFADLTQIEASSPDDTWFGE